MSLRRFAICAAALAALSLGACATGPTDTVMSQRGAVELRAMQSRAFETADKPKVFRAVLSTFQDLGYTITKVEPAAGTVTADKLARLSMTATIYPRGENRTIVRSNAIVRIGPDEGRGYQVDAPEFYQQRFFEPLSKALFLTALYVDEGDQPLPEQTPTFSPAPTAATPPSAEASKPSELETGQSGR